jgi:argininosuccinate lyase
MFDSVDTVKACLEIFAPMVETMRTLPENMYNAAGKGFINATDLADYLTKKGMPFRTAYKTVGEIVAECIEKNTVLDKLTLEEYKAHSDLFENDLYNEISLETCVEKRISAGGTGNSSVLVQIEYLEKTAK